MLKYEKPSAVLVTFNSEDSTNAIQVLTVSSLGSVKKTAKNTYSVIDF